MKAAISAHHLAKHFPLKASSLFSLWLGRSKTIPYFEALKDVNLHVQQGEMLGVLGANGAGKSTLLRTLAGIYHPDRGEVHVTGSIAGLFELGGFGNRHMTGRTYVKRFLQMRSVPRAQHAMLIEEIREFSELGSYFDKRIRTYSAGMSARLYFAAATALPHDVYLIDEILSVGDEHFQVKSWSRIRERLSSGVSGILVTHDWSAVIKLCRRACVIEQGRITQEGPADATVVSYLHLPVPESQDVRVHVQDRYTARSGEPLSLEFEVELLSDRPVEMSLSIEYLMLGFGWEIVLLSDYMSVGTSKGRYRVRITAPDTPLRVGEYMLNLFLSSPPDAMGVRTPLHCLGWTYGNGLTLHVEGEARSDIAPFPVQWKQVSA